MADPLPQPPQNTSALATGSHEGVDGGLSGIHPEGSDDLVGADDSETHNTHGDG